jgi:hypothetical protein
MSSSSPNKFDIVEAARRMLRDSEASTSTESEEYNLYVRQSMLPVNKISTWIVTHDGSKLPVVAVINDSPEVTNSREIIKSVGKEQFRCRQCGDNCRNLSSVFGPEGPYLCNYDKANTTYTNRLRKHANDIHKKSFSTPNSFTLSIATDKLLCKDRHSYVRAGTSAASKESRSLFHYAGNCETVPEVSRKNIKMLNSALRKYWILIHDLFVKLTVDWGSAGMRHATKQRIESMKEVATEVTYIEEHFGKTFEWILSAMSKFSVPFDRLPMNDRIRIVSEAIGEGHIGEDGNGEDSVVHFQYSKMNNTVLMWMKKAGSRAALKSMMASLIKPSTYGKKTSVVPPNVNQISEAEKALGENFWTRVATTKSLTEYYKDYTGPRRYWQSPNIDIDEKSSGARGGFASLRKDAAPARTSVVRAWEDTPPSDIVNNIPDLIELMMSGKNIFIPCTGEHGVVANTSIGAENLLCKPVKEKGGLLWSFLGGKGYGANSKHSGVWQRLIAIHEISAGNYSNYILVTASSIVLPSSLMSNVVLAEHVLSSKVKKHLGLVISKMQTKTRILTSTSTAYKNAKEYPIIGVGLCSGPGGTLAHGHTLEYAISPSVSAYFAVTKRDITGTITRYTKSVSAPNLYSQPKARNRFCTNCAAPAGSNPTKFCGNCGSKM